MYFFPLVVASAAAADVADKKKGHSIPGGLLV